MPCLSPRILMFSIGAALTLMGSSLATAAGAAAKHHRAKRCHGHAKRCGAPKKTKKYSPLPLSADLSGQTVNYFLGDTVAGQVDSSKFLLRGRRVILWAVEAPSHCTAGGPATNADGQPTLGAEIARENGGRKTISFGYELSRYLHGSPPFPPIALDGGGNATLPFSGDHMDGSSSDHETATLHIRVDTNRVSVTLSGREHISWFDGSSNECTVNMNYRIPFAKEGTYLIRRMIR